MYYIFIWFLHTIGIITDFKKRDSCRPLLGFQPDLLPLLYQPTFILDAFKRTGIGGFGRLGRHSNGTTGQQNHWNFHYFYGKFSLFYKLCISKIRFFTLVPFFLFISIYFYFALSAMLVHMNKKYYKEIIFKNR